MQMGRCGGLSFVVLIGVEVAWSSDLAAVGRRVLRPSPALWSVHWESSRILRWLVEPLRGISRSVRTIEPNTSSFLMKASRWPLELLVVSWDPRPGVL